MLGMIAESGIVISVFLLVFLVFLGAIVGVLAIIGAVIGVAFKGFTNFLSAIFGVKRPYVEKRPRQNSRHAATSRSMDLGARGGRKLCAGRRCGYANRPSAVYCGRCGQRL